VQNATRCRVAFEVRLLVTGLPAQDERLLHLPLLFRLPDRPIPFQDRSLAVARAGYPFLSGRLAVLPLPMSHWCN
jgi:hypothetical protein